MYRERNDECRNQYLNALNPIPESKRVYVDETGFNEPVIREFGYGKKGERVVGERTGKRFARTSLIAGLKNNKPVAPLEFKGYCDTEVVLTWVRERLIPALKPGDVVIWDNAIPACAGTGSSTGVRSCARLWKMPGWGCCFWLPTAQT